MKNCTALWREAHFEVKMLKAPHCRSTFGSSDVGNSAAGCGREARLEVKMLKAPDVLKVFGCSDVQKNISK